VAKSAKSILISSLEPLSGKSGTVVGLAHLLRQKGLEISYGKPVGNCPGYVDGQLVDEDVEFIRQLLELSPEQLRLPLIYTDADSVAKRLQGVDKQDYGNILAGYLDRVNSDITPRRAGDSLGRQYFSVIDGGDGQNSPDSDPIGGPL
jgi:BioD-like phosphotransacetylase family protein